MAEVRTRTRKKMPKQARAKARVEAILQATDRLLRTSAVEEISTTAIAGAAEVPVGSVYQYFEDRNDILSQLYAKAYDEVNDQVVESLSKYEPGEDFDTINRRQLQCFWQAARAHPTFRALTRWANHEYSFADVTPGAESGLGDLVQETLKVGGIQIDPRRKSAVLKTTVTLVSVLVDVAIEEENEDKAEALIDELATVLSRYLS